jgi:hypothetical protein
MTEQVAKAVKPVAGLGTLCWETVQVSPPYQAGLQVSASSDHHFAAVDGLYTVSRWYSSHRNMMLGTAPAYSCYASDLSGTSAGSRGLLLRYQWASLQSHAPSSAVQELRIVEDAGAEERQEGTSEVLGSITEADRSHLAVEAFGASLSSRLGRARRELEERQLVLLEKR